MTQKVVSGHRVRVSTTDPATGRSQVVGIFSSVSYNLGYGAQDIFILGRTSAAAIQYTHAEPITVRMTAWRSIDHGPHADGRVPNLKDLLQNPTTKITLLDRQLEADGRDGKMGEISDFVVTGFDTTINIKQAVEYTISGRGLIYSDETAANSEAVGATNLP